MPRKIKNCFAHTSTKILSLLPPVATHSGRIGRTVQAVSAQTHPDPGHEVLAHVLVRGEPGPDGIREHHQVQHYAQY